MKKEVAERKGKHVVVEKINKNNGLVLDGLVIMSEKNKPKARFDVSIFTEKENSKRMRADIGNVVTIF